MYAHRYLHIPIHEEVCTLSRAPLFAAGWEELILEEWRRAEDSEREVLI